MEKRSLIPPAPPHHVAARAVSIAVVILGLILVVVFAWLSWASAALWTIVALLCVMAFLRLVIPGRPWFSSRNRIADMVVLLGIAALIAYFSPFVNLAAS